MPGFNISIGTLLFPPKDLDKEKMAFGSISAEGFSANRFTLKKFLVDKIFTETKEYILILEGVILNKKKLNQTNLSWSHCVWDLYKKLGDSFISEFRGSFSGALFDKSKNKWLIFTDHIGSKHIYYSLKGENLFFSSEIADIYDVFKKNKIHYSLDEQAAYMLLSYGYMLGNYTLCAEIRKLPPGSYIKIKCGNLSFHQYYQLTPDYDDQIQDAEAIERIDELFRQAIRRGFDKDLEYGFQHLVGLSGGLDSRMTSWVANDMGYKEQINLTFSQSNYLDEVIPKKIAADLGHEWIFKALDNGLFLKDIDEISSIGGGSVLYFGLAHGYSAYKHLSFEKKGILHTGQLGDVVISTFGTNQVLLPKLYSKTLAFRVDPIKGWEKHNYEILNMYERGFNGANCGLLSINAFTETYSPFYDVDLMNFCFNIPVFKRLNHRLYKKWILTKYPRAANYIWEAKKSKITDKCIYIRKHQIPIRLLPRIVIQKFMPKTASFETANHMNPLDYWYKTNHGLRNLQNKYFEENIERLNNQPVLQADSIKLYKNGNALEKTQVLTLLSAIKLFFI